MPPAGVTLRDVRPAEESALRAIQRDVIDEPSPRLLAAAIDGLGITRVAVDDGPIGYGFVLVGDGAASVPELAVEASAQRRGIGTALLEALAECARETGAETLRLTVHADDERARRFYRVNGFEEVDRQRGYFETGSGTAIDLARPL